MPMPARIAEPRTGAVASLAQKTVNRMVFLSAGWLALYLFEGRIYISFGFWKQMKFEPESNEFKPLIYCSLPVLASEHAQL